MFEVLNFVSVTETIMFTILGFIIFPLCCRQIFMHFISKIAPDLGDESETQISMFNSCKKKFKKLIRNRNEDCPVCLDTIRDGEDEGRVILGCNHEFHYHCIAEMFMKTKNYNLCPMCRKSFKTPTHNVNVHKYQKTSSGDSPLILSTIVILFGLLAYYMNLCIHNNLIEIN